MPPAPKQSSPDEIVEFLHEITDDIHQQISRHNTDSSSLAESVHGMCDRMTAIAIDRLQVYDVEVITFVGLHLPRRIVNKNKTHSSHTIGIVHRFSHPPSDDLIVWFDYACAQYGIEQKLLVRLIERDQLYRDLSRIYGGGIWLPGGNWLSQLSSHSRP